LRVLLDTNRNVDVAKGLSDIVAMVESAAEIYVPFVVLAELRSGFVGGNRPSENVASLLRFLGKPNVNTLFPTEETTF